MAVDESLKQAMAIVPECLACAVVDVSQRRLLGTRNMEYEPEEIFDVLPSATADLFEGPLVKSIENAFMISRGQTEIPRHSFQEIVVVSQNVVHVLLRSQQHQALVVGFVCRRSVNLTLALLKAREAVEKMPIAQLRLVN